MPTAKDMIRGQKLRKKIAVHTRPEDIGSVFDVLDQATDAGIRRDIPPELDIGNGGNDGIGVPYEKDSGVKSGGGKRAGGGRSGGGRGGAGDRPVDRVGNPGFRAIQKELEDIRAERRKLSKELNDTRDMEKDERDDLKLRNSLLDSREQSVREELKLFYKKELTELGQVSKIRIVIEDYTRPVPAVTSSGEL